MSTTQFIDELAAGNASGAKDILNDMLSARAFEALEGRKVEIAQNIFNGSVQEEQLNLEDYSLEELEEFMVSEEFEQLDELSKTTLGSYVNKASGDATRSAAGSTSFAFRSTAAKNPRVKDAAAKISDEEEARKQKRLSGVGKAVKKLTK
jgi:hypothetical protein